MKINEHVGEPALNCLLEELLTTKSAISTPSLLLVPYCQHHVPTYHDWMRDPALQEATASEPLDLDHEYAMQRSWRTDHDKLTFIICLPLDASIQASQIHSEVYDGPNRMIGDINLFLFELDDEADDVRNEQHKLDHKELIGEIELMIAAKDQRKKGYGRIALLKFMDYVLSLWPQIAQEFWGESSETTDVAPVLAFLRVRINHKNVGSIHLFKSLNFQKISEEPNYFGEVEMRWRPDRGALVAHAVWEEHHILAYD